MDNTKNENIVVEMEGANSDDELYEEDRPESINAVSEETAPPSGLDILVKGIQSEKQPILPPKPPEFNDELTERDSVGPEEFIGHDQSVEHDQTFEETSPFNNIAEEDEYSDSEMGEEMNEEEIKKEKEQLLFKLWSLRKRGYQTSRQYTLDSDLDDMRDEYQFLKNKVDMEASRAFSKKMLVMFVTIIEFCNDKWDPFELMLDGWSESVHENIEDYDEVFDQLYEKYKHKVAVAPEIKLMLMLGGSAFMFHMTNSMFNSNSPGTEDVDAIKQMMSAAKKEVTVAAPIRPESPKTVFTRKHSPTKTNDHDTIQDVLNFVSNPPNSRPSNDEFNSDNGSEHTFVSEITTGGSRRRKRKRRKVLNLEI
jgi:hypothetical protein